MGTLSPIYSWLSSPYQNALLYQVDLIQIDDHLADSCAINLTAFLLCCTKRSQGFLSNKVMYFQGKV